MLIRLLESWLRKSKRDWRVAAIVMPGLAMVYLGAHWLRFEDHFVGDRWQMFVITLLPLLIVKYVCFSWSGVFHGWQRVVAFHDLMMLTRATTASSVAFALLDYLLFPSANVPRSIFVMDWAGTLALVGAMRSLSRLRAEVLLQIGWQSDLTTALIVGTDEAGDALLSQLRRNPNLAYRPVGFTTRDASLVGTRICGVPVAGTIAESCEIAERLGASEVLVTHGTLSGKQLRHVMRQAELRHVNVKVLPSYEVLLDGSVDLKPRQVSIEDLLRREPVQLDQEEISHWISGRALLVTGSAGSIGSEICRQLVKLGPACLICIDRCESGQFYLERELKRLNEEVPVITLLADVGDESRMSAILREYRPAIIFHAAAYKHVPLMEECPGEAIKNIVLITQRLADLADQLSVESFVMVSTDKAVNPTNVMGACKRVAELYIQSLASESSCRFVTVRFGNVLDSAGSVVPIFREQIARGGPVTVTHPEMTRYFMTIPEAAQLVIQAGAMGDGGEIFVLDMGSPVRILDLAQDMIRLSGLREGDDIEIEFVGCRPGEKLFEELRLEGEPLVPTRHPKITVVESQAANRLEALRIARRLENLANGPSELILSELQRAVPQFRHASHAPSGPVRTRRAA